MFEWLKKKNVSVHVLDENEITERIDEGKLKGHNSAFFYNAELSEDAKKMLEEKNISIRYRDYNGVPAFEIFWK